MPHAAALLHADLGGDAVLQTFDVADDADHLAAGIQGVERVECHVQRFGVERSEAFVEEQRVDGGLVADQIGQRQRQSQADQEALAA